MVIFSPGRYGDSKNLRMPERSVGSIFHESAIQNSASSHTSPGFASCVACDGLPCFSQRDALHRLAEAEPAARVRLLAHRVVPLGAEAHRQDVVGEPRGLAPHRRQRDVQADLRLVLQHFHPREAVGIRPERVVDAREVDVELAAPFLEEVRQQKAHLEERERELLREEQLVPVVRAAAGIRDASGRTCS